MIRARGLDLPAALLGHGLAADDQDDAPEVAPHPGGRDGDPDGGAGHGPEDERSADLDLLDQPVDQRARRLEVAALRERDRVAGQEADQAHEAGAPDGEWREGVTG